MFGKFLIVFGRFQYISAPLYYIWTEYTELIFWLITAHKTEIYF